MFFRPKKVVLFLEIVWVKKILSLTRPHSRIYQNIFFLFLKETNEKQKKLKKKREKQKPKKKGRKKCSEQYLENLI